MSSDSPILIIGAGVVGLILAQSLKKDGIPFLIFDRDEHIEARGQGWGITIHWALSALQECLPENLYSRLPTIEVDPAQGRNDTSKFLFLNLASAEPVFEIPPSAERRRINREKFRKLLLEGIDVQWSKSIANFTPTTSGVTATFRDGTKVEGRLLIGSDGATSKVRRLLCPETGALNYLPVGFMGTHVKFSPAEVLPLRSIDPLAFLGCHPETGTSMWFSTLDTPEVNGSSGEDEYYTAQLSVSWPVRGPEDAVPASNAARKAKIKQLVQGFYPSLKKVFTDFSEEVEIKELKLADWPCLEWPGYSGRVTLTGDAAHAMTMYRGEAANHGIVDARNLHHRLLEMWRSHGEVTQEQAIETYESEMRDRTVWAVLMSREACIQAHDFKSLNKDSAVVARRAMKV